MSQCKNCSKNTKPLARVFCDDICYNEHRRKTQVKLTCSFCNREFWVSKKRSTSVSHCSRFCYIQAAHNSDKRVCKDCKELKDVGEFNIHSLSKDLRRRYCIDCERKRACAKAKSVSSRWTAAKYRASKSGNLWDIPLDLFEQLLSKNCHYCGGKLNPTGCGLDRKDNLFDYTTDNVVPCCRQCNVVKNHFFTYDEMMVLSPTLNQIREQRDANGK